MNKQFKYALLPGIIASTLALTACGGGSSSSSDGGSTGEPVVTRGAITQLGSIWVNGVKYETPEGGSYTNDDSESTTASFQVGQVVSIRGRRNDDGVTGTADEVEYEAEIEGAADADNMINGVKIITDNTLTSGTRYEVSGFWVSDTIIEATFIKTDDDGDSIDEIKGTVTAVSGTDITVRGTTYTFGGSYDDSIKTPEVGDFVEVHFSPGTTVADKVELEDDFFDDISEGQEVEFEGAVNLDVSTCPAGADFMIDATCIDWDSVVEWSDGLTGSDDMAAGTRVEAEGHFSGNLLIAEKIKGRGNRVRAEALATSISDATDGTLILFAGSAAPITVSYNSQVTEIEFDGNTDLSSAGADEGLEIRGIRTGDSAILALRIRDKSVNANSQELRAIVDDNSADETANTISVMGITAVLGANTQLEDDDVVIAIGSGSTTETQIDEFLGSIDDDGIVAVGNGANDVIEIRIDTTSNDGSTASPYAAEQVEIEREDD